MSSQSSAAKLSSSSVPSIKKLSLKSLVKNHSILIVCVVILILVVALGYKFSTNFMNVKLLKNSKLAPKNEFKIVTPQCIYGGLKNDTGKVLVVNVLSDKMPVFLGIEGPDEKRSVSKAVFEQMLQSNGGQVPSGIDMVILMCAGWSCGAAKSYFEELAGRGVNVSRVTDYAGGIHEWCLYSLMKPNTFKFFNLRKPDQTEITELNKTELMLLIQNTAHGYKTNTVIQANEEPHHSYCKLGEDLPNVLVA